MRSAGPRVAHHAARLVRDGSTVLTHSFSSTVFEALRAAHSSGCRFRVLCTESLPMREGAALAASLAREAIMATVIPDAAVESFLPQAGLVLVGADSVSARGLVNKTGTALIARAACALQIPMYALCSSDKFLPPDHDPPRPREGFHLTPLRYLAGIVTEEGITSSPPAP
jgi:translation initiation factor 2B subunit (eIF-2B alpha/beta/delta family)